jgi:hypothetical protein
MAGESKQVQRIQVGDLMNRSTFGDGIWVEVVSVVARTHENIMGQPFPTKTVTITAMDESGTQYVTNYDEGQTCRVLPEGTELGDV